MNTFIIVICGLMAVAAGGILLLDVLLGQDRRIQKRLDSAQKTSGSSESGKLALFRDWKMSDVNPDRLLGRCRQFVEQSGLTITLTQLVGISIATGAVLGAITYLGCRRPWVAGGIGVASLIGPVQFVAARRRRRIDQFSQQLPDVFDVMSRAVAAGQTVPSAMQLVATECRPPLSTEFALCYEQQNLGLPYETTLRDLAKRVPVSEFHIFVIALLVQRQCGGSPVEVLNIISDMIRKRTKLAQRVRALTGEGRMQAIVLTVLPVAAFLWLWVTQPDYIQALMDRPWLLSTVVALQIVGTLWVRRTVKIEY